MDDIRKVFAKASGVSASWFSFNSKGACPVCKGTGQISYDMAFAEPVVVTCEECGGRRYNPKALSYRYRGMSIEDAMVLTVREACEVFEDRRIRERLQGLVDVGLDYLTLGQPTSTLSGGEVQRVKLASELGRARQVYVLDGPSTGLHYRDVERLYELLQEIVEDDNTVVVIEHRLELIARADWVIDMGPDGRSGGGLVVFAGTPADFVACPSSKTGRYLSEALRTGTRDS